jgi:hypothetical protein
MYSVEKDQHYLETIKKLKANCNLDELVFETALLEKKIIVDYKVDLEPVFSSGFMSGYNKFNQFNNRGRNSPVSLPLSIIRRKKK